VITSPIPVIEFLYDWRSVYDDAGEYIHRFPIVKRTERFIYVNRRRYDSWSVGRYDFSDDTQWQTLSSPSETGDLLRIPIVGFSSDNGFFYHRSSRQSFYLDMPEKWKQITSGVYVHEPRIVAWYFAFFGFGAVPSAGDFEKAYRRKALKLHPDLGGTKEAFQELEKLAELCRNAVSANRGAQ